MSLTPEEWVAVRLSLKVALWATVASLPVAIAVAYALARGRFPGRAMLDGLVHLPLVLHRLLLPLDRGGSRGSRHGLSPGGARHQAFAGGDRRAARGGSQHARRQ